MPKINYSASTKNASIRINIDFPTESILDKTTSDQIGRTIRDESIKFMEKGVSPVNGKKFESYKNPLKYIKSSQKKYPGKKKTPVNLKLSGNLYASLSWVQTGIKRVTFGLINPIGKVAIYGPVHNKDDRGRPDIPERRFIPTRRGEQYNRTIMLALKRVIVNRMNALLKR